MVTIKDIAKLTGVSCTTVSNVIHGRSTRVSEATVQKINHAIEELGYVPNMSARSLVSNSSHVIALINHIVTPPDNLVQDPFYTSIISTIEYKLRQSGYYLMIRTIETSEDLLTFLRTWSIDGLIFTGMFQDSFYDAVKELTIPIVLIDSYVKQPNAHNIGLEDFQGSFTATSYLLERGHKKIAFASPGIKDGGVLQERFLGYKAALIEHGISFDSSLVVEEEMDLVSAKRAGAKIAGLDGVTGVVVTADIMAAGIMVGLKEQGLHVPEDISVIGFDDIDLCQYTTPALTTIHQDIREKGRLAVKTMLRLLENPNSPAPDIILPTTLMERKSVRDISV